MSKKRPDSTRLAYQRQRCRLLVAPLRPSLPPLPSLRRQATLPDSLSRIRDGSLALAYPQQCRVCGSSVDCWDDGVACARCWDHPGITPLLTGALCAKCGTQLSRVLDGRARGASDKTARFCGACSDLPFAAARACGSYTGALEANILFLKVNPHICARLRRLIGATFVKHRAVLESEVVIPVPLHRSRQRRRGFNQSSKIASVLSHEFELDMDDRSLVRMRSTERHRAGMDAADRARSVEGAFEVVRPRLVFGKSVLLVDDVYTTGSTICSAASCLIEAGAGDVKVLTIARVTNI